MSLYDTLNVTPEADQPEIKKAYRRAAAKAHPDKDGGSNEQFHQIQVAYDVLSDPQRRKQYDQTGQTDEKPQSVAESRLLQLFNTIIQGESFTGDIIATCRDYVDSAIKELNSKIVKLNAKQAKLQKQMGRVKSQSALNLYEQLLNDTLMKLEHDITANSDELAVIEEVSQMLEEYNDSNPETVPAWSGAGGGYRP